MASTKHDPKLPKRFIPLLNQATTEATLRYGGQESGLQSIFDQATRQYSENAGAQRDMGMSLLGSLGHADQDIQKVYSDAGLTPSLLSQIAGSPTGQRLAGEFASNRADIKDQTLGAQAGQQYIQQHLADNYRTDVNDINRQWQQLNTEKGLFQQATLDQLIAGDRSMRHDANLAAAKLKADADQAALNRDAAFTRTLATQGLVADENGNLSPLPGGKADPNAPGNKPKRTTGPGTANKDAQLKVGQDFSNAFGAASKVAKGKAPTSDLINKIVGGLVAGRPAGGGQVIYDEVPVLDKYTGKPTGQTKQVPRIDKKTGQRVTSPETPAVSGVDRPVAQAAAEMAVYGYVTTNTVRALQKLGYSVNQIPGLVTQNQHAAATPPSTSPTTQRTRPKGAHSIRDIYG